MTSIFIFISGATLLVYSAERLIGSLVGISRGLAISVFLLAIIFTGIEFDDIVLGIALNLQDNQDVALGLVIGTAVSFSGIVLALGAILAPTSFNVPREYIVVFALAPLIMLVFAVRKEVTIVDAVVLILLFVLWIVFVAVKESRRETPTFRNLEIVEEYEEGDEGEEEAAERSHDDDAVRAQAADTMSLFRRQGRWSGWINLGLAVIAIGGIIIGAKPVRTKSAGRCHLRTLEPIATLPPARTTIPSLPVTEKMRLPMTLPMPISGTPSRIGRTVRNRSSMVSTAVTTVAPKTVPSML